MTTTTIGAERPDSLAAIVARRARGLRAELGLTQAELGARLGISTPSMSERLRGAKDFDLDELPALADALTTSVEYLLGLTDVRAPSTTSTRPDLEVVRHEGLEPPTRCFGDQDRGPAVAALGVVLPFRRRGAALPAARPA